MIYDGTIADPAAAPDWRAFIGNPDPFPLRSSNEAYFSRPSGMVFDTLVHHEVDKNGDTVLWGDSNGDYIPERNNTVGKPIEIIRSIGYGPAGAKRILETRIRFKDMFPMPDFAIWSKGDVIDHGTAGSILGEGPAGTFCPEVADIKYYDPLADVDITKDLGPNPWIEWDPNLFPFEAVRDNVKENHDEVLSGKHSSTVFASEDNPKVFYCSGDLEISACEGYGLVLVEGALELKGDLLWKGLIIAGGSIRFSGGGNKHVEGAVVSMVEIVRLDGGIDVWHNCEVLQDLSDKYRGVTRLYWRYVD
jgi:hypothetical protein